MKRVILFTLLFLAGCRADRAPVEAVLKTVEIESVSDLAWTYFSIESGRTVGTSVMGNAEQDAAWFARRDWDIALCGDMIRTNSGTSGCGRGGIMQITDRNFNAIDEAPASGYLIDTEGVVVKD